MIPKKNMSPYYKKVRLLIKLKHLKIKSIGSHQTEVCKMWTSKRTKPTWCSPSGQPLMPDQIWFANHLLPTVSRTKQHVRPPAHTPDRLVFFLMFFFFFYSFNGSSLSLLGVSTSWISASTWPCAQRIKPQLFSHRDDSARLHKSISNSHNMELGH